MIRILSSAIGVLLIIATLELPGAFYYMLRYVVTLGTLLLLARSAKPFRPQFAIPFAIMIVLFNPVDPIYLKDKQVWNYIDFIGGLFYIYAAFVLPDFNWNIEQKRDRNG